MDRFIVKGTKDGSDAPRFETIDQRRAEFQRVKLSRDGYENVKVVGVPVAR